MRTALEESPGMARLDVRTRQLLAHVHNRARNVSLKMLARRVAAVQPAWDAVFPPRLIMFHG